MRFAATEGQMPFTQEVEAPPVEIRAMTRAQLRQLGTPRLVYLRAGLVDGQPAYGIYAADGTVMSIVEDVELAIELVAEHGLTFVAVH